MSLKAVFLLSSYGLIFLGLLGLYFTEELSVPFLLAAAASFVLGALGDARGAKGFFPGVVANTVLGALFVLTLFSIFVVKAPPIQELVHFLLAIQAVKLLAPKRRRDWFQLYLLSFFSLVASSALTVEVSFAVIFACYVLIAPWVLIVFHLKSDLEETGQEPEKETRLLSWALLRLAGATSVVLICLTFSLFISLPRLGVGIFGGAWATGAGVTGFSDHLTLGDVAQIQKNNSVAMRVTMDPAPPPGSKEFYLRGVALDLFDGRNWQKSKMAFNPLRSFGDGYLVGEWPSDTSSLIRQRIILEPMSTTALFALGRPVVVSGRLPRLFQDALGDIRVVHPLAYQVSYEVVSDPSASTEESLPPNGFLQLPALDPRIPQLAERMTVGAQSEKDKARILERFLRETYGYSLEGLPVGTDDPLAAFLFDARQGNCEYFASTLAVMLRSLGIPARVVNGYLGGEWNPYGEYFLIRQSNAHSWVEAYFAGEGWVALDPTPPAPARRPMSLILSFSHFVDLLRFHWYRYVINFSFADQYQIFAALKRPRRWLDLNPGRFSLTELRKQAIPRMNGWLKTAVLAGILLLAWQCLKRIRGRNKATERSLSHLATERYRRLLALLGKKGLKKRPGETPDEFAQRAAPAKMGLLEEFTSIYQEARFSPQPDYSERLKRMDRLLVELKKQATLYHPRP